METKTKGFNLALTPAAVETLRCMFMEGPIYDGDVPSKTGRDDLVKHGLAARVEGFNYLTQAGMLMAIDNRLGDAKNSHYRQNRIARDTYDQLVRVMNIAEHGGRIHISNYANGTGIGAAEGAQADCAAQNEMAATANVAGQIFPAARAPKKPFSIEEEAREQTEALRSIAGEIRGFLETISKVMAA